MHELPVTQSILEIVLKHAAGRRVKQINLVIGQFSTIVDDSIQFYWDIISQDTEASSATLHFHRIPGEMTCRACHAVFHPDGETFECPSCHGALVHVSKGKEFYVDSIDVE